MKKVTPISLVVVLLTLSGFFANAQYVFTRIDINPGPAHSLPTQFEKIDSLVYFNADNGTNGIELWISDGTPVGTKLLKDINTGILSSSPAGFTKYNGKIYFAADNGNTGNELWVTDGTANGTQMVADINTGGGSSNPQRFFVSNGKLFFLANNGTSGGELFVTDGTAMGTTLVKDIRPGSAHGDPNWFREVNGKLLFQARDGSGGGQLWTSDGTTNGTTIVKNIGPSSFGALALEYSAVYNNKLYFAADAGTPVNGSFWETDGTTTGTQIIEDIDPNSHYGISTKMIVFKNKIFFAADSSGQVIAGNKDTELWTSDGTVQGTYRMKDIWPGTVSTSNSRGAQISFLAKVDSLGLLFFDANDSVHNVELWATDGTANGTRLVKDIFPGNKGGGPFHMIDYAEKLFFGARDTSVSEQELWVSDGTDTGTKKILSYMPGTVNGWSPSDAADAVVCNNVMMFPARFDSTGFELWILQDTTYKPNDTTNPPVSIIHNTLAENSMTLSPNPAQEKVYITFEKNYSDAVISLTDISGRVIKEITKPGTGKKIEMNLLGTTPGIYIIHMKCREGNLSKRLLIE